MSFGSIIKSIGAGLSSRSRRFAELDSERVAPVIADAGHGHPFGETDDDHGGCWEDVIARLQAQRNSHVIGLIHRHRDLREHPHEWHYREAIGTDHLEDFLTAMRLVPAGARLDVVLHSIGGDFFAVQAIARAIKAHDGETTVFVPYYAKGVSTLIALAAERIAMGSNAALSFIEPVDKKLETVLQQKGARRTADLTLLRLHVERNWGKEVRAFVGEIAQGGHHGGASSLSNELVGGKKSQWDPLTFPIARRLGLSVTTDVPADVFELIKVCRACPVPDQGVKTAGRAMSSVTLHSLSPTSRAWPLRAELELARLGRTRSGALPPVQLAEHGDDDEPGVVSAENCNITVRPLIAKMEASRGSRVLCMIHRATMESGFLDTVTTEDMLSALQAIDPHAPLDIILHTPGGMGYEGMQIARAIKAHKGRKTVFVPYFSMSAGTIVSLAADEIVMSPHAVLGPIDAQVPVVVMGMYFLYVPTRAVLSVVEAKPKTRIGDDLLEAAIDCKRDIIEHHRNAMELMAGTYSSSAANKIAHRLNDGELTHGYPLTLSGARQLGLKVSGAMPAEAIDIVRAFRRSEFGQRSVLFC